MAPMTRSKSPGHIPTAQVAEYYTKRAQGGVGLIITEGTAINHPAAHGYPDVPNFHGQKALSGWQRVVDGVHQAGGMIFPQLWHVGSVRQKKPHQNPGIDNPQHCCECDAPSIPGVGPSAIAHPYIPEGEVPHAMSTRDIQAVIDGFVRAAEDAKKIGFDGIELHGAHGYLIDQFFWATTNQRQDSYGGKTLAERTRFAVDLIGSIRQSVGKDFPISLRISQWKMGDYKAKLAKTAQQLESFLTPLVDAGVDIFHCSTRRFYEPEFADSSLNLAGWVKKITSKPSITVGSVGLDNDFVTSFVKDEPNLCAEKYTDELLERFEAGEFDFVAVGRMLLSNPNWVQLMQQGKHDAIRPFAKAHLHRLD